MTGVETNQVTGRVVRGHQVASGKNGDARFPGGTLAMQLPHFRERGLDLSSYFSGTINVSIAPRRYRIVKPRVTFKGVKWHPTEPAEDFSFFDVKVSIRPGQWIEGLIYFPHPETKPEHFQQPDVLELLLPYVEEITESRSVQLQLSTDQIVIE